MVLFFKNYILLNFQGYVTVQLSRFLSFLSLFRQLLDDITEVRICQELFLSFLNQFSVKRRRRDLNPCAAINDLLPFQGSPFGQLGYFSKLPYAIASHFFRSVLYYIALFFICQELFLNYFHSQQRREWDSNPRALADKRFSRPPRYDHFDISPILFCAI